MFYQSITISFFICISVAQEHLTCLRTDDFINPSPRPIATNAHQGRPGRRGPRGPPGPKGEVGSGMKGEPGILNNSQINELKGAFLRGYVELNDGWIAPFNGYQYKATPNQQSWEDGQRTCQSWGGDLADEGIRDLSILPIIFRGLSLPVSSIWIGLSDQATEGTWIWLSGRQARTDDVTLWASNEPDDGGSDETSHDCAISYFNKIHVDGFHVWDEPCSRSLRSLFEKPI